MSEKTANDDAQQGMKIRKKQDDGVATEAEMSTVAETEQAAVEERSEAPAKEATAEHVEAAAPTLHRRVVDPKEATKPAPRTEHIPATSFESGTTEDFAALFEGGGEQAMPTRRTFDKGEKVQGKVTYADSRFVYVDLGGRGEARASREQYLDEEGNLTLEVGESYEFTVIGFSGGIELGNKLDTARQGLGLRTAFA